jgi:hypothetical protein
MRIAFKIKNNRLITEFESKTESNQNGAINGILIGSNEIAGKRLA